MPADSVHFGCFGWHLFPSEICFYMTAAYQSRSGESSSPLRMSAAIAINHQNHTTIRPRADSKPALTISISDIGPILRTWKSINTSVGGPSMGLVNNRWLSTFNSNQCNQSIGQKYSESSQRQITPREETPKSVCCVECLHNTREVLNHRVVWNLLIYHKLINFPKIIFTFNRIWVKSIQMSFTSIRYISSQLIIPKTHLRYALMNNNWVKTLSKNYLSDFNLQLKILKNRCHS